jgi:lipopolysaccharide transport system permease protein
MSNVLTEFAKYRELLYFLAWRDIKIRYKQTSLGLLWAIIQPLLTMIVFTFLFGRLGRIPSDGNPHSLFYLTALLPWIYFSSTLTSSSNSLISNSNLLTKVYFPRVILPASAAISGLFDFSIGTALLAGLMAYYNVWPQSTIFLWPLCVILLLVFTLGVGMFLAALNVKYRDVKYAVPFAIQLGLFVTPVIYPISLIPERYRIWIALNPLAGLIEAFRASLLPSRATDWQLIGISAAITCLVFVGGFSYFIRTEKAFADII